MYNRNFELTIEDVDLIEKSLNDRVSRLTELRLTHIESTIQPVEDNLRVKQIDNEVSKIQDLLGRIHNQKIWYRPRQEVYVGG